MARAVRTHSNFHCYQVLKQPPAGWSEGTGRITVDVLRRHLPSPGPGTAIFLCGPPPMVDALEETLQGLGYPKECIILPSRPSMRRKYRYTRLLASRDPTPRSSQTSVE